MLEVLVVVICDSSGLILRTIFKHYGFDCVLNEYSSPHFYNVILNEY